MILRAFNALLLGSCLCWLLLLHRGLVSYPHPVELSEGSMVMSTRLIMQGKNPWALERQPQSNNCYGAGYNLAAACFAKLAGTASLASHRALSGVFILLSCLLLYAAVRLMGLGRLEAGWLIAIQYSCLLYYCSPLARPDAQGLFFIPGSHPAAALLQQAPGSPLSQRRHGLPGGAHQALFRAGLSLPFLGLGSAAALA